jgi:hypothetical protein
MSQHQLEKKLNEYISSHPEGVYEEWIGTLHPEAKEDCLLEGLGGEILIDQEYYAEDSEHRNLWNTRVEDQKRKVPSTPVGSESNDDVEIFDLLGDKEKISSPWASATQVSPDVDLMSFD